MISEKGKRLREQLHQRRLETATRSMSRMEKVVLRGKERVEHRRRQAAERTTKVESTQKAVSERHAAFVSEYREKTERVYARQKEEVAKVQAAARAHVEHVKVIR